jgi:hypothetical protein
VAQNFASHAMGKEEPSACYGRAWCKSICIPYPAPRSVFTGRNSLLVYSDQLNGKSKRLLATRVSTSVVVQHTT